MKLSKSLQTVSLSLYLLTVQLFPRWCIVNFLLIMILTSRRHVGIQKAKIIISSFFHFVCLSFAKKAKQDNSRLWLQREGHTRLQFFFYWLFEWNNFFFVFLFQKFTVHVLKNHILAGRLPLNNHTGDLTVTTLAGTKLLIRQQPNVSEVELNPLTPSLVVFDGQFLKSFFPHCQKHLQWTYMAMG